MIANDHEKDGIVAYAVHPGMFFFSSKLAALMDLVGSVSTSINAGRPPIWDMSELSLPVLARKLMRSSCY
jgi:hypothetical protein